ncbi:MAG: phosphocholine cytidylyltransferase family protein [Nitrospinae bacterium]|nr:phosphocholine cytidylyltransferase family protein [Nitrospinota bacterium]
MSQVITKAVILAAGMGLRMKAMGEEIPKGFILLDDRPIIEHSLSTLISCGIREIMIVTGHKAEYYEKLKETYPEIRTVENTRYAETGTICSLGCARDFVDADFILLESDLVYDPTAITGILNASHSDCLLLSGTTLAGDEVYVEANENCVTAISKNRDHIKDSVGEYIGIAKISKQLYDRLIPFAESNPRLSYDMDCLVQIASEHPVFFFKMEELDWAEIDDLSQLTRAQKVWERIKASRP